MGDNRSTGRVDEPGQAVLRAHKEAAELERRVAAVHLVHFYHLDAGNTSKKAMIIPHASLIPMLGHIRLGFGLPYIEYPPFT